MKRLAVLGVFLTAPFLSAADATADVRNVLADQVAAWNKGDVEGYMKGYWRSDDLTFYSGGSATKGWKQTLERYKKNYTVGGKKMGTLAFSDLDVTLISETAALVRGKWKLTGLSEPSGGLFTLVVKKLPEGWRIVHDHTSK
ncbi:MAG TPA: nuclear transport factor 2 family protein [Fimbriiglobus sp.]|jgi:beta-aspartyl-peptidase (threonine type)